MNMLDQITGRQFKRTFVPSMILWGVILFEFLFAVTTTDQALASSMTGYFRALLAMTLVWYALIAVNSKGKNRFAVGVMATLLVILLLQHASRLDLQAVFARWIYSFVSMDNLFRNEERNFVAIRSTACQDLSLLLCSAFGGITSVVLGDLSNLDSPKPNQVELT